MEGRKNTLIVIALAALLILGGALYYFEKGSSDTDLSKATVGSVSKLILLPQGEEPTVATVSDPVLLHDQPFFANAEKGDQILIYAKAQKAYLYRPSAHKLIEVSSITTDVSTKTQ